MFISYMFKLFAVFALSIFVISGTSYALNSTVSNGTDFDFNKTQYFSGKNYEIKEAINGDIYCVGNNVTFSGSVNGDVLCMGSAVYIDGLVNGNARILAKDIHINGLITGNASFIGQNVYINNSAKIKGDITTFSSLTQQNGSIARDANINTENFEIDGTIERNLYLHTKNINYGSTASVLGDIQINGERRSDLSGYQISSYKPSDYTSLFVILNQIVSAFMVIIGVIYVAFIIGLLITALVLALLFPRSLKDSSVYAKEQPVTTILAGILVLWFTPSIILILFSSIIGFPLAIAILGLYISLIVLSIPFTAYSLGSKLFPARSHAIRALGGAVLLLVIFAIPILNILVFIASVVLGAGLISRLGVVRYNQAKSVYNGSVN